MTKAPITIDEALQYLGIDEADGMVRANVQAAIDAADAFLMGAVGTDYPREDPRAKMLAKATVADLYDDRGMVEQGAVQSSAMRRLMADYLLQLRLELEDTDG